jgi:hypothetical protein
MMLSTSAVFPGSQRQNNNKNVKGIVFDKEQIFLVL